VAVWRLGDLEAQRDAALEQTEVVGVNLAGRRSVAVPLHAIGEVQLDAVGDLAA